MGVLYHYFSAPSDEVAAATLNRLGGPGGGPPLPMPAAEIVRRHGNDRLRELLRPRVWLAETGLHVVATKGFDPTELTLVAEYVAGADSDGAVSGADALRLVAEGDGGEVLVLALADQVRAVLAGSTAAQLEAAARQWVRGHGSGDNAAIVDLLGELSTLATGAVDRGEGLYCWVCV